MFFTILKFELNYWLKSWSFYAYLSTFFLLACLSMAGASGAFGAGSSNPENIANAPLSIYGFVLFFNKFLLFLLPAVVGSTIYKDFKNNIHRVLYTYPFSKLDYLSAKFISAFLVVAFIAFAVESGLILGTQLPTANPENLLPFDATPYLQTYFLYLIPNLLLSGTIVFSIVLISRNIYAGFIAIILFWLFKEIIIRLIGGHSADWVILLTDPFGEQLTAFFTRYWTLSEQNTLPLPVQPILFINRLIWLSVSVGVFIISYRWFSFSQEPWSLRQKKADRKAATQDNFGSLIKVNLPKTNFDFSFLQQIKTAWSLSRADFIFITKSNAFISIVIAGGLFIAAILLQMNPQTDTKILPATWVILGFPVFFFSFLIQILTYLYAGVLVHRAKTARMADLIAVTTVPNWVLLLSKFFALAKMQVLLLSLILVAGVLIQLNSNYYHFEIGHYLFDLFAIHWIGFIIWAFAALLVQSVLNNIYLSLFVLILAALGISQLPSFGIENVVFRFNESPNADFFLKYSDMNGHGHALWPYLLYKFYWFIFGLLLFCTTLVFWQREHTNAFMDRWRLAKKRGQGPLVFGFGALLSGFFCFGFYLFQQENKPENKILNHKIEAGLLSEFQKKYANYAHLQQPRITALFVKLDIFPETNAFKATGKYRLVNKTAQTIDTLFIKSGYDEITTLHFENRPELLEEDTVFKFSIYKLVKGIAPGDSMTLSFTIKNQENALIVQHSNVLNNGTYLKSDIFPRLGYFGNIEKKPPSDSTALDHHYQSRDADLIHFEAIVSTCPTQIALAPGALQKEWVQNNRRYFHYKMNRPIKFVLGFHSGEYSLLQEKYKDIDLRIYYHPTHTFCLQQMLAGLKTALDYNTTHFGPYQHQQIQIIEFPRSEGSFATTSGNCIQISEIRFLNDTSRIKEGSTDLSFYVAAHELSHQWWGNQVIPADALGATMITESVSEYITAKIYEKHYGKQRALKFLDIQRNRYLSGRAKEPAKEPPLYLASPEQSYITYGKGAIALYTLSEYIGEEKMNAALKAYLNKVKFQAPPYTTSLEMLDYLSAATPDSLHYLITDMFEKTDADRIFMYFDKVK